MVEIKLAQDEYFEEIWSIINEVLKKGDTYPFARETTKKEAFQMRLNSGRIWDLK